MMKMTKKKRKTLESLPLSDIEIKDIRLAEEEYAKGEALIFDSVEEMMDNIMPKEEYDKDLADMLAIIDAEDVDDE